ncbi:MAG: GNAT family N-acetyltransferase [Prolixibacteraceae bacterium]|jgi:GNAT superfamily N-acetyltransferase|nr:GNAT family N-acetyltransferase [Prolixibacteraceae bacterium]
MATTVILSHDHRTLTSGFNCGKFLLDTYIKTQASQDVKRKLSACFVSVDHVSGLIQGYYTFSNNSIPLGLIPENYKNKLPVSYSSGPATLLGRLAVDARFQGAGIGKMLLIDALNRSHEISQSVGSFAVVVDPLDDEAARFYTKYGFILLPDSHKMFLPMKTVGRLFEEN